MTRNFRVLVIVSRRKSRLLARLLDLFAADLIANARHKLHGDAAP
jgi:hypothetical protein